MASNTSKKRGRPFQDKAIRPYSVDKVIAEFVDTLPDGERSRFVNNLLKQGIKEELLSGKFYTYLLLRPNGSVFYVGKGTGNSIHQHEMEAKKGVQSHKCNVIRQIWSEGEEVIKQKVGFFDDEKEAYELEIVLIKFFGREKLANITDGGEGKSILGKDGGGTRTNLSLPPRQKRQLEKRSQEEDLPMAEIIRRALDAYLAWDDPAYQPVPPTPQTRNGDSSPHK